MENQRVRLSKMLLKNALRNRLKKSLSMSYVPKPSLTASPSINTTAVSMTF